MLNREKSLSMTSKIHHPVPIQSRGLIICEMDEETTEPKTILEIGGVNRPRPTYLVPSQRSVVSTPANQSYLNHWKNDENENGAETFSSFSEYQEQKIVRLPNCNWIAPSEKVLISTSTAAISRGEQLFFSSYLVFPC